MDRIFFSVLNMSITGAFVIVAICLARLLLRKSPKMISYCMWAAAGFRLVFPLSIESAMSLLPFSSRAIAQGGNPSSSLKPGGVIQNVISRVLATTAEQSSVGATSIVPGAVSAGVVNNASTAVNAVGAADAAGAVGAASSSSAALPWSAIFAYIWLIGVIVMIVCGVASIIRLKRNIGGSVSVIANVYEAENIRTPFVLGFLPPTIYIPAGLAKHEKKYVIMHEGTHISRRDHITKVVSYLILSTHWFNPFVWVAFKLMSADMEMSCDETVLKNMESETKLCYAQSLLRMAAYQRHASSSLIAFGGKGVKKRVRNILRLRRYPNIAIVAAVVLATVFSLGLSLDRPDYAAVFAQNAQDSNAVTESKNESQFIENSTSKAYTNTFGKASGSEPIPSVQFYQYRNADGSLSYYAHVIPD